MIHRDLKPANIMLGPKGTLSPGPNPVAMSTENYSVKIIDYGMAREEDWTNNGMTNMVGSLFYRAP